MPVGNIGIFDTKQGFGANKSFKNTIYSRNLEFKSRLAHQKVPKLNGFGAFYYPKVRKTKFYPHSSLQI